MHRAGNRDSEKWEGGASPHPRDFALDLHHEEKEAFRVLLGGSQAVVTTHPITQGQTDRNSLLKPMWLGQDLCAERAGVSGNYPVILECRSSPHLCCEKGEGWSSHCASAG